MNTIRLMEAQDLQKAGDLGGGKYRIRVIAPGRGANGLYIAENLTESLPVFTAGTQMYLDHPTETESWERPERSVRDLAAKFITDAWQEEDGSIMADIFVYESFRQIIREKWEDIGVSIHAWSYGIMGPNGEVPPFDGLESVDFVTKAGAGGAIIELLESAKPKEVTERATEHEDSKENKLDKELLDAVQSGFATLSAELKGLVKPVEKPAPEPVVEDTLSVADSLAIGQAIAEAELPEGATERVIAAIEAGGDYKEAIASEVAYIAKIREAEAPVTEVKEAHSEPKRVTGFKKVGK